MRGNRGPPDVDRLQLGSIPACAGEPPEPTWTSNKSAVYPRVCGGTVAVASISGTVTGLSPRVRGNPANGGLGEIQGSIPACAGEPLGSHPHPAWKEVYPRVCGGTVKVVRGASVYPRVCGGTGMLPRGQERPLGLSPRVRGNRGRLRRAWPSMRSIPACAGEPV